MKTSSHTVTLDLEEQIMLHNIAWLRKHYGYSQKRMAKLLGIGIVSLRKIEKGEMPKRLGAGIFMYIYANFGIRPAQLLEKGLTEQLLKIEQANIEQLKPFL